MSEPIQNVQIVAPQTTSGRVESLPSRVFAALPDALTALVFIVAWIAPGVAGPQRVKNLMLTMLIEFIVMHSSAFYAAILGMDNLGRAQRTLFLAGLSAFYLLFIVAFSFAFDSTWPIWAFGWLLASSFWHLWITPAQAGNEATRLLGSWAISAAAYIGGVFLTIFLPLPSLGITPAVIASLHISPNTPGLWIEKPWIVLAFGAFYFGVLAWTKFAAFDFATLKRMQ